MARKGGRAGTFYAEQLRGPTVPASLAYLRDWLYQLVGRSGVGMSGAAPLSYGTVADWARLTGNEPTPDDIDALFFLDAALRSEQRDAAERAKPIAPSADMPNVPPLPTRQTRQTRQPKRRRT